MKIEIVETMSQIKVKVKWKEEELELKLAVGSTPVDAIKELGVNLSTKIVMRKNVPIPIDETLEDGDELWIIETVSGG